MKKIKVSFDTWLQLLGMLGVLGGLVALVIELNQSQKLSQANAYQIRISEIQEAQRELGGSMKQAGSMFEASCRNRNANSRKLAGSLNNPEGNIKQA